MVRYVQGLITGFFACIVLALAVDTAARLAELEEALVGLGALDPIEVQRRVEGREL